MALRGPTTGAAELNEYYHKFLAHHQHGEIDSYQAGQNIAALGSRMTRPEAGTGGDSFRYLPASEPTAQRIYTLLWVTVLLLFLGKLIALRLRSAAVSAFELAMVFLTALLLSPITFTTHLVPLLFVFAVLLSVRPGERGGPVRLLAAVLVLGMAVCGLSGRDLAGDWAYENVAGYSICAWTMLVAFGSMVVAAGGRGRVRP